MENNSSEENKFYLGRHSIAEYKSNREALESEDPAKSFDRQNQIFPDLAPEGIKLAREKAKEFFASLNPETDVLFFASSDMARALETANIYREVAEELGFKIIEQKVRPGSLAEKIGGNKIRPVPSLSFDIKNILAQSAFNPMRVKSEINWEAVPDEERKKWEQARDIIGSDDHGSWGSNYHYHSVEVKKLFPEVETAEQLYHQQFRQIIELIKFAKEKIDEAKDMKEFKGKKIKVIGFGHENYLSFALEKYFDEHSIGNCEMINFNMSGEKIFLEKRGEKKEIESVELTGKIETKTDNPT
jgi:hypothetical protein